jgi:hypothetical protein
MDRVERPEQDEVCGEPAGIVIQDQWFPVRQPVISAFIWGGKVRPLPTLPFGRWKPSPA